MEYRGGILGNGWSLAWRVYDAQYWGVPQRRKRIYLVADFASERAPEILFECKSKCRHPAESGTAEEGTSTDAEGSAGRSGGVRCLNPWDSESKRVFDINGAMHTLYSHENSGGHLNGICYALDCRNLVGNKELSATLNAKSNGGQSLNYQNPVCYHNAESGDMVEDMRANGVGGGKECLQ